MSKAEQILQALMGLLATIPDVTVRRNEAVPVSIPQAGLLIIRDGDQAKVNARLAGFKTAITAM